MGPSCGKKGLELWEWRQLALLMTMHPYVSALGDPTSAVAHRVTALYMGHSYVLQGVQVLRARWSKIAELRSALAFFPFPLWLNHTGDVVPPTCVAVESMPKPEDICQVERIASAEASVMLFGSEFDRAWEESSCDDEDWQLLRLSGNRAATRKAMTRVPIWSQIVGDLLQKVSLHEMSGDTAPCPWVFFLSVVMANAGNVLGGGGGARMHGPAWGEAGQEQGPGTSGAAGELPHPQMDGGRAIATFLPRQVGIQG